MREILVLPSGQYPHSKYPSPRSALVSAVLQEMPGLSQSASSVRESSHYGWGMKTGSCWKILSVLFIGINAAIAQTTIWHAADNPHVVSGTYTVPVGQTLLMEAGVIVDVQANSTLQVDGQLIGNGTAGNHIKLNGAVNAQSTVDVRGTSDLKFTEIRVLIAPDSNGVLLFADSSFLL